MGLFLFQGRAVRVRGRDKLRYPGAEDDVEVASRQFHVPIPGSNGRVALLTFTTSSLPFEEGFAELRVPLLGICLGMQLLYQSSEEGGVACLGLLEGRVARMAGGCGLRLPHMGWNSLEPLRASTLLDGISAASHVFFVHGFAAAVTADCVAGSNHGQRFAAIVQRGHVCGVQFHPERSADTGARLLANFLAMEAA